MAAEGKDLIDTEFFIFAEREFRKPIFLARASFGEAFCAHTHHTHRVVLTLSKITLVH